MTITQRAARDVLKAMDDYQPTFDFTAPQMPQYHGRELEIAGEILRATSQQPVSIQSLVMESDFKVSERRVKQIVEELRDAGFIVCAKRGDNNGYYQARTIDEAREGLRGYWSQAITQITKIRRLCNRSGYRELAGQLKIECEAALREES